MSIPAFVEGHSLRLFVALAIVILNLSCVPPAMGQSLTPGCPGSGDSHGSYPFDGAIKVQSEPWYQAIGPDHMDVRGNLNGLAFCLDKHLKRVKVYRGSRHGLEHALVKAQDPDERLQANCDLGCYEFLLKNYAAADKCFTRAIMESQTVMAPYSLALAPLYDLKATAIRAMGNYTKADQYFLLAARCRSNAFPVLNRNSAIREFAHSSHSRAMNFYDECVSGLTNRAWFNAVSLEYSGLSRPYGDAFAALTGGGGASIVGNWLVPHDITLSIQHETKGAVKELPGGVIERTSGHHSEESNVGDIPVYLCQEAHYAQVRGVIEEFAKSRGLNMADFGTTWPALRKQSEELLLRLQSRAESLAFQAEKTDKDGGFEFLDVPNGNYFLFGSLATQRQAQIWFIRPIVVNEPVQQIFEFDENNAERVWVARGARNSRRRSGLRQPPVPPGLGLPPSP